MRRSLAFMAVAATASLFMLSVPDATAKTVGTAPGIHQGLAKTGAVERAVRVCRHRFWTSRRECFVDRSRPPTVCHHIRSTSRRDCY
jgi:hypothetical protein